MKCNPAFKILYQQLGANGQSKKAVIAYVRKIVVILNSMVRDGVKWGLEMGK